MGTLDFFGAYESSTLEAKEALGGLPKNIWETYSAFANTRGGTILLGVRELQSHELIVTGLLHPEELIRRFWNDINNPQIVSANILTNDDLRLEDVDGQKCIVIRVPRAPHKLLPIFVRGNPLTGSFRRNGEGDYHCSTDEVRAMMRDAGSDNEQITALEGFGIDSLCLETVQRFWDELQLKRPQHPWLRLSQEELLVRLGAASNDANGVLRPTRAGLLVFGWEYEIVREYPFYSLDYREQTGERRWEDRIITNDGEWSGNLFDFWFKVSRKLSEQLKKPFDIAPDFLRLGDSPLHIALREALANTLLHADYHAPIGSSIIFEGSKVTFSNSGRMLVPPELAQCGGLSLTRNPSVARMLALVGIGEKAGSGFDAMNTGARWAGLPAPLLTETFSPDRVVLEFILQDGDTKTSASPQAELSSSTGGLATSKPGRLEQAVKFIKDARTVKRTDIERALGISKASANVLLSHLERLGTIKRTGKGKATRYRLVDDSKTHAVQ